MARKFQVDNAIAADIKSAASDSFKDNIRMIEIDRIKTSMDNFYSISDIEILTDDIERQGLKHNLVVAEDTENPDTYFIKSGHRRFTAIKHLISENRYGSKFVPCLVDGTKSHSENILDLIIQNIFHIGTVKTEIYRSKLLELNSEFEKLIKSADTVNTIQQIAVDMINKISDIQMEVTNG